MMAWIITATVIASMIYVNVAYTAVTFDSVRRGPPVYREFGPFRYTNGAVLSSRMLDGVAWWEPILMCTYFNFFAVFMLAATWPDVLVDLLFSDWAALICASPCIPVCALLPVGAFVAWRWPYRR